MTGEGKRPLRGLRAFLDPTFKSDHTPVPSVEQTDSHGQAGFGAGQPGEEGQAVAAGAAVKDVAPSVLEVPDPSAVVEPVAPLAITADPRPTSVVLPAPGQR